ncbi:hypothetical protein IAR50_000738 [Cryptococcus sp. DSM 104548]
MPPSPLATSHPGASSLILLPTSPAASTHSSLVYEEASFDRNALPPEDDIIPRRPVLGLIDILSMRTQDSSWTDVGKLGALVYDISIDLVEMHDS